MKVFESVILGKSPLLAFVSLIFLSPAPSVQADGWPRHKPTNYASASSFRVGLYLDYVRLSSTYIEFDVQGVGESAFALGATFNFYPSQDWVMTGGVGAIFLDDTNEFEVPVEDADGDINYRTSSVTGLQAFIESGPRLYFPSRLLTLAPTFGAVFYGATNRSVAGCVDCPEENVDLVGGAYVGLGLQSRHAGVQFQYHLGENQDFGIRFQFIF